MTSRSIIARLLAAAGGGLCARTMLGLLLREGISPATAVSAAFLVFLLVADAVSASLDPLKPPRSRTSPGCIAMLAAACLGASVAGMPLAASLLGTALLHELLTPHAPALPAWRREVSFCAWSAALLLGLEYLWTLQAPSGRLLAMASSYPAAWCVASSLKLMFPIAAGDWAVCRLAVAGLEETSPEEAGTIRRILERLGTPETASMLLRKTGTSAAEARQRLLSWAMELDRLVRLSENMDEDEAGAYAGQLERLVMDRKRRIRSMHRMLGLLEAGCVIESASDEGEDSLLESLEYHTEVQRFLLEDEKPVPHGRDSARRGTGARAKQDEEEDGGKDDAPA